MQIAAFSMSFIVPISSSTHCLAENFCKHQSNIRKARQIYLNTLAIFAVEFYLRCLKIETDWKSSLSWDPVAQTLMDVADLNVTGLGFLECRPVWPEAQVIQIPPEVWSNRIGYVAVQLDQSLRKATLVGFSETAPTTSGELPINQLQSLEDLVTLLYQLRQPKQALMRTNLGLWLSNSFAPGWQVPEVILGSGQKEFALRNASQLNSVTIKRAKLINLGLELGSEFVALVVMVIKPPEQSEFTIRVQLHPEGGATYLPPNITLALISDSGEILDEAQSRSLDNFIQLNRLYGLTGECFDIKVTCGEINVTEKFVI